ncbi:MAG TPA: dihydrodipicolinate reductase [Kouleothrix sp.]|uniref:NAD(P)H-dependent amine dehydrogenase family protein n=1 Tax=Kouleothrix sp. TaxID=2779161 RepID=UPI002CCD491C|nr:dihydrodipicolinate reductase [Kouleothrix sp.]HRC76905.1 dihydrodipicolinate reductase [Kouleothrix sp.]
MHPHPIRVVHYGLGAIGSAVAQLTSAQRGLELVGGIDRDPQKVGRDLGDVIGLDHQLGLQVSDTPGELLRRARPDLVIHATTSRFHDAYPQLLECIVAGANVISTCEELVYPYAKEPAASAELHRRALAGNATVVGAGVNPGYVMDLLPLMLTAPCVNIKRISVTRVIDATSRRAMVHQRIGAGLSIDQFREHVAHGGVRHVGLAESIGLIADGLGWQLYRLTEQIDPIIASEWLATPYGTIAPGQVAGVRQNARGWMHGRDVISLTWEQAVGSRKTHDAIYIDATPPLDMIIQGGLQGEQATAALIVHAIPQVLAAAPGLTTVLSLPPLHYQQRPEPPLLARSR